MPRARHAARRVAATLATLATALTCLPAANADPFEIQVYAPDVNRPYHFGLELHSNYVARGLTVGAGTELPAHHVLHETLEASFGLPHGFEAGAYLQTALRADGNYDYAGVKLRLKWRVPVPRAFPLQFAVNAEASYIPGTYDAAIWGSEIRPVIEWHPGPLTIDVNPIFTFQWTGPNAGVPQFEPAVAIRYDLERAIAMGVEYYAALGPVTHFDPLASQAHYLFATLNVVRYDRWEAQLGIGAGLTAGSNPLVIKCIVGHEF